jgi:hypothetical protein
MSNFFLCLLVLPILFLSTRSFARDVSIEGGVAKATLALGTSDIVHVTVATIEPTDNYTYRTAYTWGADDTSPPKNIIKTVTVSREGQTVFVPLSAYVDLGNPVKIDLQNLPAHGFRIIILGGDAAGSYKAVFDFNKNGIYHRKVTSGEFPKEVWEESHFSFNHLN